MNKVIFGKFRQMTDYFQKIMAEVEVILSKNLSKIKGDEGCISQATIDKVLAAAIRVEESHVSQAFDDQIKFWQY